MFPTQSELNYCTTSGALTATGAETVYDTTVTISFCVGGKAYTKTAVTDGTTPTTDGNTAAAMTLTANYGTVFVWGMNSSGTVSVRKGSTEALDAAGSFIHAPQFPSIPDTVTPFAYQVIKAGSTTSGTWTFGSSNWNATGITSAIVNCHVLPDRPQIS
jgi:hypothetical protein